MQRNKTIVQFIKQSVIQKQKFMISEYLDTLSQDDYLSIYLKSIEFDGLQGQPVSENLFLYGIGQSGYQEQPSRFQEMARIILEQDQSQICLVNIDPSLYLGHKQPDIQNITIDPSQLDNIVDDEQDFQISNYYRIPIVNENQLFSKTETINKIVASCNQMVLDPFEDKYYFFFPALVLNVLKKNKVVLSQAQKLYQIQDCLEKYNYQQIKDKFDSILDKIEKHGLQSVVNLSESFQLFEPQLTLNYQLEHSLLIYKILKQKKQKMSMIMNQYHYMLLKNYFSKMYIDRYESLESLQQQYQQKIEKKLVIDQQQQLQTISLLQVMFGCEISQELQLDQEQKKYLLTEQKKILDMLDKRGFEI